MSISNPAPQLPVTLPDTWLDQIKAATKQNWGKIFLTTILSSSVIGSVVSFLGNYFLETRKANVEMMKRVQKEGVDAYGNLGTQVEELKAELEDAVVTFDFAVKNGVAVKSSKSEFLKNVDNSITAVAYKIANVNRALENVRIDDPSIKTKAKEALKDLPQLLEDCQKD